MSILILKGIVVSGWHVSSASIVQQARLPDWLRHMQKNKTMKNEKNPKTTTFSEVRHDNPVSSFKCAHVNKLIIYVRMHKQKAPIKMFSQQNNKFRLIETREKPVDFCMDFSFCNNFANLGSFTKVSVSIKSIVP